MPEERYQEQSTLARAVVAAINKVYEAKRELDTARAAKINTESQVVALPLLGQQNVVPLQR